MFLRKIVCFLLFGLFYLGAAIAQTGNLEGVINTSEGEPLPYATVQLKNTQWGAVADEEGSYSIDEVPPGDYKLTISSLGFQRKEMAVSIEANSTLQLEPISLQDDMLGLDEVVVTGTMRETFVKATPIKVEVITSRGIQKSLPAMNLMDGLKLVNGVQEVVSCGVCFTNSISINGLPGPYTAVLMDGSPMYGNLASVYGLNGIPVQMVDRFEIVKGPSSTLYGSEAIAGVINIITKDPENEPKFSADILGTTHGEMFNNLALTTKLGKWRGYTGVNHAFLNNFEDDNGDGFGDIVGMDRVSLFSKWSLKRPDHKKFTIAAKLYYEDRRNGVEEYFEDRAYRNLRGDDSIYGESIYTQRAEVFGTYELPTESNIRIDYSTSWHDQDSYYGADRYVAKQAIGFTNLIWVEDIKRHTLTTGLSNRYQFYDDNTVATNERLNNQPEHQYIPGIFVEDQIELGARYTVLGGLRLDYYGNHGFIPSPRISAKVDIDEWTAVRLNAGTGFKIVNLFTEDHAFVTGQRTVEITEQLDPEKSWNVSTNLNHTHALFGTSGMFDIDLFYTRFSNKIVPDYATTGKIIYGNSDDIAETYGASMSFSQQFTIPLAYRLGLNYNKATIASVDAAGKRRVEAINFAPLWSGVFTLNYSLSKIKTDLAYTATVTGPMALPEVYELSADGTPQSDPRPTSSEPFMFQTIQVTKKFESKFNFELYGGVQNMFNYKQPVSPLVGLNDPSASPGFSPFFDTSYAYAPIHGREFYLGLRFQLD